MRPYLLAAGLIWLFLFPLPTRALEIRGVSPVVAAPGSAVTVIGGPFSDTTRIVLGEQEIVPAEVSAKRLAFTVPAIESGEYFLALVDGAETTEATLTLRVTEPTPRIDALAPSNIDKCATEAERRVVVEGERFLPGAQLLLDGAAVAATRTGATTMTFTVPALDAGIYGIQVVNPGGTASLPRSLCLNDLPEITGVSTGQEYVNMYQVVIEGRNFSPRSTLAVTEYPGEFFGQAPQQRLLSARRSGGSSPDDRPTRAETIRYVDCTTLIYTRHPYSRQPKDVSLQVVNPDGKQTEPYHLTLP